MRARYAWMLVVLGILAVGAVLIATTGHDCPTPSPDAEYVLVQYRNATYAAALDAEGNIPPTSCWAHSAT